MAPAGPVGDMASDLPSDEVDIRLASETETGGEAGAVVVGVPQTSSSKRTTLVIAHSAGAPNLTVHWLAGEGGQLVGTGKGIQRKDDT